MNNQSPRWARAKQWFSKIMGLDKSKIRKPVFIVGCGRSGTTLLFDLLSQHPELARTTGYPDGEDHEGWIKHGQCIMAGIGNVNSEKYGSGINGYHACLHMDAGDVTPEIVEDMHAYYWNDVLKKDSARRVINKCPHNSNKLDYMLGIFPDARIVHIVRDCEPMVASWIAVMKDHPSLVVYWPEEELPCLWLMAKPDFPAALRKLDSHERFFPGGGAALWIDYWIKTNMGIERQMQGRPDQLLTVRYEDLVADPDRILGKIAGFCELSPHEFSVDGLDHNTAAKHRHLLPAELVKAIGERAEPVRRHFGYGPAGSSGRNG